MFKRNKVPQRKEFLLETCQIKDDIRNIESDPEQVKKLYACLDEKPPKQEKRFSDVQEYLKDTDTLEEMTETLKKLVSRLQDVQHEISAKKNEIIEHSKHILLTGAD